MAEAPGLEVGVLESPGRHLLRGPFAGGLEIRRAGKARAVDVGEVVQGAEDLRVLRLLLADAPVDVGIGPGLRGGERGERGDEQQSDEAAGFRHDGLLDCSNAGGY